MFHDGSKKTYVLYHRDQDGFGAAYAAWRKLSTLGGDVKYISVQYNEPMPEMEDNSYVYILDFSYSPDETEELRKRMEFVGIFDHHKTTAEAFKDHVSIYSNHLTVIDQSKSGCRIAWDYFNFGHIVPDLILDIEDRDLWKFERTNTEEIFTYLSTEPWDFQKWHNLCCDNSKYLEAVETGKVLLKMQKSIVKQICRNSFCTEIDGHKAIAVNSSVYQSEVGQYLLKQNPECNVAIIYADIIDKKTGETKSMYSLRSRGDIDVSEIAKKRGGGGHKAASGYILKKEINFA